MEFKEVVFKRRSNRFLNNTKIKDEDLDYILEIAQRAPVGRGKYDDIRLVLVEGEALEKIKKEFIKDAQRDISYNGGAMIYIMHKGESIDIANQDGATIAQNICLAAAEKDIGSVYLRSVTRFASNENINHILQKRLEERIICAVTLGHKTSEEVSGATHKIEILKLK